MKVWSVLFGLCLAMPLVAKVPEAQAPKDVVPAPATSGKAATSSGSVGPATYNRIFTGSVDNNCNAASTLSASGTGVAYATVTFHTTSATGEPLVATINPAGTTITDTTLSIYCVFDPANAQTGLVAYNDDSAGLLSAFNGTEGVIIQPGRTYTAVVSLFSPGDIGGGTFQLDLGGQLALGAFQPLTIPASNDYTLAALIVLLASLAGVVLVRRRV
ncbi:hypothetical protein [Pseudomarimonas arenosa]|uniref:Gram-positive cocci surface proteins LPxTG domain-containing protein n=1 Tax=Pseudomarimonas arenosa TaxID=2774145 RepID=A0AAW3ZLN8_9GAMM|nr:hypothetical protein [Pseudomarimonas arenosa]MBD8526658.1 hypothetical protein [Pseudomarimonas arenosa]